MFLSKLMPISLVGNKNQVRNQKIESAETQIKAKPYVDPFLDSVGWYALGHHDRKQFLSAVIKEEKSSYHSLHPRQVHLSWAKFDGNSFELVNRNSEDAQPITLIEIF